MRCKSCDYTLWNLKARQCPECGTPFVPSEFEFVVNSVRFCCPQCDQPYYGTGANGHLIPNEFNCVKCALRLHMDQMVLRPAEGVQEEQTQVNRLPWLERGQRGFIKSWFGTVIASMAWPNRLVRALPVDSSVGQSWWYAAVTIALIMFGGVFLGFAGISLILFLDGDPDAPEPLMVGAGFVVFGTPAVLILAWVWAVVTHGILKITGGTAHSMGRTVQAIMYGTGTQMPMAVPFLGPYCGIYLIPIWWIVSAVLMVAEAQRVRHARASLAVLLMPGLIVLAIVGTILFAFLYAIPSSARQIAMIQGRADTLAMTQTLANHAQANNGQWPDHAAQLVADRTLSASSFVSMGSATGEDQIPVADTTLSAMQFLRDNRRSQAAQTAADALPADVIAHRLGDFVFTWHGIDPNASDPGLWIVINATDPALNPLPQPNENIAVGHLDGTVRTYPASLFSTALAEQNALRQTAGLPPLPDPRTVTHDAPAEP